MQLEPMPSEAVRVRPIRIEDAPAVADLSGELGYRSTAEEMEERIRRVLKEPGHQAWVAIPVASAEEDRLAGRPVDAPEAPPIAWLHAFLSLRLESSPSIEIAGLVVSEPFRGRGIGRRLLATAEHWAASQGISAVRVRSRVSRAAAHRFYERAGYSETKEQKVFAKKREQPDLPLA
jgi:GNAT superfamily N-acetyltransferase